MILVHIQNNKTKLSKVYDASYCTIEEFNKLLKVYGENPDYLVSFERYKRWVMN